MTETELFGKVLDHLKIKELHPLHKALIEECCENAINNKQNVTDLETLIYSVEVAFLTSNSLLKGTLKGALLGANANQITLNYRDQTFIILENSEFVKD